MRRDRVTDLLGLMQASGEHKQQTRVNLNVPDMPIHAIVIESNTRQSVSDLNVYGSAFRIMKIVANWSEEGRPAFKSSTIKAAAKSNQLGRILTNFIASTFAYMQHPLLACIP